MSINSEQLYAELYDNTVPDWDGEIDFYRELARGKTVLEVACGTGRVTLRLVEEAVNIVGTDLDEEMLAVARKKSEGMANVRWERGDMRTFDLGSQFDVIISPGHSFQFMCTPEDQLKTVENFRRHLLPGGMLVIHLDHQDLDWLGGLKGEFEQARNVIQLQTGNTIRSAFAWTYERATQTATVITKWEEIGSNGSVLHSWESIPKALHCVFRFEMEHLLARAGFEQRIVYGDFFKNTLNETSSEMIWVTKNIS